MRKITPKPILKLRDPIAIIRDNKIIANQNLYTEDGELLTPQGYDLPRFTTAAPVVGDHRQPSSSSSSSVAGLVAESGRSAVMRKRAFKYNNLIYGNWPAGDDKLVNMFIGIDSLFPGVYRQKSGDKAGRVIARHLSGYIDVTSDVRPEVLESLRVTMPESVGSPNPSNTQMYLYPSRIVDETDGAFIHLSQNHGWALNSSISSQSNYPVQMTNKEFNYRFSYRDNSKWQQYGIIPIAYDEERKVLFGYQHFATTSNAYGTTGLGITPLAFKFSQGSNDYEVQAQSTSAFYRLDSFINSTYSLLNANSTAGWRNFLTNRAIQVGETKAAVFSPVVSSRTDVAQLNNQVGSVTLARSEYDYVGGTWTNANMRIVDENDQPVTIWEEEQFPMGNSSWSATRVAENNIVASIDMSFLHEIDGETYVSFVRVGTAAIAIATPVVVMNTVQYVFKLDPTDPTKATLVTRHVTPGLFGVTDDGMSSFVGNTDYSNLYLLGNNGVYRVKFDTTVMRYVMDDTMINVPVTELVVTDSEDLWILDIDHNLYSLRSNRSDIVRVAFAEGTNTEFDEAPYDVEVRVSTVNHLGRRASRAVELVVEGNAVFKANNRNKITVTTSATDDITAIVTVKDYGQIYVTPTSVA